MQNIFKLIIRVEIANIEYLHCHTLEQNFLRSPLKPSRFFSTLDTEPFFLLTSVEISQFHSQICLLSSDHVNLPEIPPRLSYFPSSKFFTK